KILDFSALDVIVVEGAQFALSALSFSMTSNMLEADTNGDGFINMRISLWGAFEPDRFRVEVAGDNTEIRYTGNSAPVAVDDSFDARFGITLGTFNLLANDFDPDGDPIEVVAFSYLGAGSLAVFADGDFAYSPAAGFSGIDSFTYIIRDSFGAEASATVTLDVGQPPPPPPPGNVVAAQGTAGTLHGTDGPDILLMGAARTVQMYGGPGEDIFVFGETPSNGIREMAYIRDYEMGVDRIDLFGAQIAAARQTGDALRLTLAGSDGDTLVIFGVTAISQLTFTDEWSTFIG
ncbi:Ig-like domain-containing protein, partial [Elioraea sp.]|uniref:Ig-like domain-containing protein n=1 Tax=Elioraea sp. TaxID=2185103 RepID=UPI003F6FFB46